MFSSFVLIMGCSWDIFSFGGGCSRVWLMRDVQCEAVLWQQLAALVRSRTAGVNHTSPEGILCHLKLAT